MMNTDWQYISDLFKEFLGSEFGNKFQDARKRSAPLLHLSPEELEVANKNRKTMDYHSFFHFLAQTNPVLQLGSEGALQVYPDPNDTSPLMECYRKHASGIEEVAKMSKDSSFFVSAVALCKALCNDYTNVPAETRKIAVRLLIALQEDIAAIEEIVKKRLLNAYNRQPGGGFDKLKEYYMPVFPEAVESLRGQLNTKPFGI